MLKLYRVFTAGDDRPLLTAKINDLTDRQRYEDVIDLADYGYWIDEHLESGNYHSFVGVGSAIYRRLHDLHLSFLMPHIADVFKDFI